MGRVTPNIGITGVESIRIGGMLISDLPIAEAAQAKTNMRLAEDAERLTLLHGILRTAPKQHIPYLQSRVKEAEHNIKRIRDLRAREQKTIDEYRTHITLCEQRDKEIAKTDDPVRHKELYREFPPYNVVAMLQQIKQCEEGLVRCDGVIDVEYKSIAEMNGVLARCAVRDQQLKALGARFAPKGATLVESVEWQKPSKENEISVSLAKH